MQSEVGLAFIRSSRTPLRNYKLACVPFSQQFKRVCNCKLWFLLFKHFFLAQKVEMPLVHCKPSDYVLRCLNRFSPWAIKKSKLLGRNKSLSTVIGNLYVHKTFVVGHQREADIVTKLLHGIRMADENMLVFAFANAIMKVVSQKCAITCPWVCLPIAYFFIKFL